MLRNLMLLLEAHRPVFKQERVHRRAVAALGAGGVPPGNEERLGAGRKAVLEPHLRRPRRPVVSLGLRHHRCEQGLNPLSATSSPAKPLA